MGDHIQPVPACLVTWGSMWVQRENRNRDLKGVHFAISLLPRQYNKKREGIERDYSDNLYFSFVWLLANAVLTMIVFYFDLPQLQFDCLSLSPQYPHLIGREEMVNWRNRFLKRHQYILWLPRLLMQAILASNKWALSPPQPLLLFKEAGCDVKQLFLSFITHYPFALRGLLNTSLCSMLRFVSFFSHVFEPVFLSCFDYAIFVVSRGTHSHTLY